MTAIRTGIAGRTAIIGLVAAALALGACGRKGGLELPPDASVTGQPKSVQAGTMPAKVPDKPFILDRIL